MSNFSLKRHYPKEVEFWVTEEVVPQMITLNAEYQINVGTSKLDPLDWRVELNLRFSGKASDVEVAKGKIVFVGYFGLPEELPEKNRAEFVAKQGASILYAASRELLTNLSCRSPHIHLILAPTTFAGLNVDATVPKTEATGLALP
jgi:preprotein translocase subunit SecB